MCDVGLFLIWESIGTGSHSCHNSVYIITSTISAANNNLAHSNLLLSPKHHYLHHNFYELIILVCSCHLLAPRQHCQHEPKDRFPEPQLRHPRKCNEKWKTKNGPQNQSWRFRRWIQVYPNSLIHFFFSYRAVPLCHVEEQSNQQSSLPRRLRFRLLTVLVIYALGKWSQKLSRSKKKFNDG